MKLIPLTQGQFAKVDDEDFKRFGSVKWYAAWSPLTDSFYAQRTIYLGGNCRKHKTVQLHRAIMGAPVGKKVDHKNHDTLDCQKSNLREATQSQNLRNRNGLDANNTSGVRGVCLRRRYGDWQAYIKMPGGRQKHLGYFKSKKIAASVRRTAELKYHGEFAGAI